MHTIQMEITITLENRLVFVRDKIENNHKSYLDNKKLLTKL